MNKSQVRNLLNVPAVILLGIVLQIGGSYLVNAFCIGVPGISGVPASLVWAIRNYQFTIEELTILEPKQIAYVIIAAPLIEEIVFRILFFANLVKFLPFWAANIIQSVLFGIYHKSLIQGSYAFLMGLVLGAVFYYIRQRMSDSLIAPLWGFVFSLLLHITINTSGLYLAPLLPSDLQISTQVTIGIVCVFACLSILMFVIKLPKGGSKTEEKPKIFS